MSASEADEPPRAHHGARRETKKKKSASKLDGVRKRQGSRSGNLHKLRQNLKLRGALLNKLRRGLEDSKKHPRAVVGALELVEQVLDYAESVETQRLSNEKLERRFVCLQEEVVTMRRRHAATTIPPVLVLGAQRASERFWRPRL